MLKPIAITKPNTEVPIFMETGMTLLLFLLLLIML